MKAVKGIAASGHEQTSAAAARILETGGNAFDAALAAMVTACVTEPMLASLGGGGFLMAQSGAGKTTVFDFFTHTPARKRPQTELDFYPIVADFGTATQEFHIGMGSIAVPGVIAGLFEVHGKLCRLPLAEILAPAIELARSGVRINAFQNYITHILSPIVHTSPAALQLVATDAAPDRIAAAGEWVTNPHLANALEAMAAEGRDWFYRGEPARQLVRDCQQHGGMLQLADLADYQVEQREAVKFAASGAQYCFNSPPAPSGGLLAVALSTLEGIGLGQQVQGGRFHSHALVHAMEISNGLRRKHGLDTGLSQARVEKLLDPQHLRDWRAALQQRAEAQRGTTHISVADAEGNLASLTISNGEGCAYVLPGTGIMMNNMLGEEDLNPGGFHAWTENCRMASMMCPAVARLPNGARVALGSGGSNRIRSAVMQVLVNLTEFNLPLAEAIAAPRLHLEGQHLDIEPGFGADTLKSLLQEWPDNHLWPGPNMFFGGVHAVEQLADGRLRGAGDPRRNGAVASA